MSESRRPDSSRRPEGIIVLGAPRSGTTLLRRLLDAHPSIACPPETYLFGACARFLASDRGNDGLRIGVLTGLAFAGFEKEEVESRLRELAFGFLRDYARRQGKARWAEKSATDAFHVSAIERLVGDRVRYLCVERHGLDVACSMQELSERSGGYLRELHEYVKRHPRPLEAFAHAWVDVSRDLRSLAERQGNNALLLRYEELVADPEAVVGQVMSFLGESWDPAWLVGALREEGDLGFADWKSYARAGIDGSSVGRWKSLPRSTASELAAIVNPTLEACGYPPVKVAGPPDEEEARRRYRLGLSLQAAKRDA